MDIVMDAARIRPQKLRVLIQLCQAVAIGCIGIGDIDSEQVAVRIEVTAKPMNRLVGNGRVYMRRAGPGLTERQLPLMDSFSPHVDERGPRSLGCRVEREPVKGLVRLVHANLFCPYPTRTGGTSSLPTAALVPGFRSRQCLVHKIGRWKLKDHNADAAQVAQANQAEKR